VAGAVEAAALRGLSRQARGLGTRLLAGLPDPHTEWLTLLWGPRLDRAHALSLWRDNAAGRPAPSALPEPAHTTATPLDSLVTLLRLADAWDALDTGAQQTLRRRLLRHRRLYGRDTGLAS
jgi:hypothetical protein